jgi:hypothetical protein
LQAARPELRLVRPDQDVADGDHQASSAPLRSYASRTRSPWAARARRVSCRAWPQRSGAAVRCTTIGTPARRIPCSIGDPSAAARRTSEPPMDMLPSRRRYSARKT